MPRFALNWGGEITPRIVLPILLRPGEGEENQAQSPLANRP